MKNFINSHSDVKKPVQNGLFLYIGDGAVSLLKKMTEIIRISPLEPLEDEILLVQNFGMAQWLLLNIGKNPHDLSRGSGDLSQNRNDAKDQEKNLDSPFGLGIASGIKAMLPAQFLWEIYRIILDDFSIPPQSPFEKDRLFWHVFNIIHDIHGQFYCAFSSLNTCDFHKNHKQFKDSRRQLYLFDDEKKEYESKDSELFNIFEPILHYLESPLNHDKLWQLSSSLADLYDSYQIWRPHWLKSWEENVDNAIEYPALSTYSRQAEALQKNQEKIKSKWDKDEAWQRYIWHRLNKEIESSVPMDQRMLLSRGLIHQKFLEKIDFYRQDPCDLPKRIMVFGISSLPPSIIQAFNALSRLIPVHIFFNKISEIKEPLQIKKTENHIKDHEKEISSSHSLTTIWEKPGQDFFELLKEYKPKIIQLEKDELSQVGRKEYSIINDKEYSNSKNATMPNILTLLQNDIRGGKFQYPSNDANPPDFSTDDSLIFHISHSPQRELEILHDQLLEHFRNDQDLKPGDIMVMVPDIDQYAPYIMAVFNQYEKKDNRFLPFQIFDQKISDNSPMFIALDKLLNIHKFRFEVSEIIGILQVPAIGKKFDFEKEDLEVFQDWIVDSNIRWGLDAEQKLSLGLFASDKDDNRAALHKNTWAFGLERMLLGYAVGESDIWDNIAPYPEIGGKENIVLGKIAHFIDELGALHKELSGFKKVSEWLDIFFTIPERFFCPVDIDEKKTFYRMQNILIDIENDYNSSRKFNALGKDKNGAYEKNKSHEKHCVNNNISFPHSIISASWLEKFAKPEKFKVFLSGSINFATLLPMRAIPFKIICILGLNDGDFPRKTIKNDFDLLRYSREKGDRVKQEDDRYMLLEAIMSARKKLYFSWVGKSSKDNSLIHPSLLLTHLRDHTENILGNYLNDIKKAKEIVKSITFEHPLQPFDEQYYENNQNTKLFTYNDDWLNIHKALGENCEISQFSDISNFTLEQLVKNHIINTEHPAEPFIVTNQELNGFLRKPVQHYMQRGFGIYFYKEENPKDIESFQLDNLESYSLYNQFFEKLSESIGIDSILDSLINGHALYPEEAKQKSKKENHEYSDAGESVIQQVAEPIMELWEKSGLLPPKTVNIEKAKSKNTLNEIRKTLIEEIVNIGVKLGDYKKEVFGNFKFVSETFETKIGDNNIIYTGQIKGLFIEKSGNSDKNFESAERWMISFSPSDIYINENQLKKPGLLKYWIDHLTLNISKKTNTIIIANSKKSRKNSHIISPLNKEDAKKELKTIISHYICGLLYPLPLSEKAGLKYLEEIKIGKNDPYFEARKDYESHYQNKAYDLKNDLSLKRIFPDFQAIFPHNLYQNINRDEKINFHNLAHLLYKPFLDHLDNQVMNNEEGEKNG